MKPTCLIVLLLFGCQKHNSTRRPIFVHHAIDTINTIYFDALTRDAGWNALTGARIGVVRFDNNPSVYSCCKLGYHTIGIFESHFFGYDSAHTPYYLRYQGRIPLLNPDSVVYNTLRETGFHVDSSLLGKPIYKAYRADNDSLYKTFYFADSAFVIVNVWFPDSAGNPKRPIDLSFKTIADTYNYYLDSNQFNYLRFGFGDFTTQ